MYAKVFSQIYDGTLCTKGPWQALVAFQQLLVLADQDGNVDMTPAAIARRTTIPLEIIEAGIAVLLEPDHESRTPTEEGRRIIPLADGRNWGWRVVNYKHYRALKREEDRRDYHRDYWNSKRSKSALALNNSTQPQQAQPSQPIAEAEAEAEKTSNLAVAPVFPVESLPLSAVKSVKPKIPDCPHIAVLALWAEVLPSLPQHNPGQWRGSRASHLKARWRETAAEKGWTSEAEGLVYLRKLFAFVGSSQFLTGKSKTQNGRRPFVAELEWLILPSNWAKTIEGKYHGEAS